jgi:hypothetical protein
MASGNFTQRYLLDVTSVAATGAWVPLDYRNFTNRTIQSVVGNVVPGDTVFIEVTNEEPFKDGVAQVVQAISTVSSYTSNFNCVIYGPVAAIRARKVGTTGPSRVVGILG